MIKVYGGGQTRSLRVLWMLEEMGLGYELRPVSLFGKDEDAEFKALNPAGFVPVLVDGEVVMAESMAILEYLAARHGPTDLAVAPDDKHFPAYLQFLHFGEASMAGPMTVTIYSKFMAPDAEKDNWGARCAVDMAVRRTALVADALKRGPYMAGDRFTAADISVAYALGFARFLGFADKLEPSVIEYLKRVTARPAYERAKARST